MNGACDVVEHHLASAIQANQELKNQAFLYESWVKGDARRAVRAAAADEGGEIEAENTAKIDEF